MDFFDFDGDVFSDDGGLFGTDGTLMDDFDVLGLTDGHNLSFMGTNSDNFIPDGRVTLERTISGIDESFAAYRNAGHIYVETSPNHFVQVDGLGTVKIHGVEYDKI